MNQRTQRDRDWGQGHPRCGHAPAPDAAIRTPASPPRFAQTRRGLLLRGGSLALAASLLPSQALAVDWLGLFKKTMADESGRVKSLRGRAFADKRPLAVGDSVPSGAVVRVEEGGQVVIGLQDGAIFTVSGGSELELLLARMSQGILNLIAGALLLVAPKGSQFLMAGLNASIGIKGTVVYRQVFGKNETTAQGMEGTMRLPEGIREYFCTCNGAVEYMRPGQNAPFFQDSARHHNSYFIDPVNPERLIKAPMLNHSDEQIRRLVGLQDEPRHDIGWLEP